MQSRRNNIQSSLRVSAALTIAAIIGAVSSGWAQLPNIRFDHINAKNGLPASMVNMTMKDSKGFMWFGTRSCPVRYDGVTFRSFRDIEMTVVTGIAEDRYNNIWFSSNENGVCRIDAITGKITRGTGHAGDFYIDSKGAGWYSDYNGVTRLDLKKGTKRNYPFKANKFIWDKASFVEDDSILWIIGRDNGLFRFDAKRDMLLCVFGSDCADALRNSQVLLTNACADKRGLLWIGSYNHGLIRYDKQNNSYKSFLTGRNNNTIKSVEEGIDEQGRPIIWIGDDLGLGIFRPDQEKFYFFENIIPEEFVVSDIFRDPAQGLIWVCTSRGIFKYDPSTNKIKTISIPSGLVTFPVTIKTILRDKTHWASEIYYLGLSHTGMLRWNRPENNFTLIPYGSASAEMNWIEQRKDGTLWIGTNRWDYVRPGIIVYDPIKEKFIDPLLARLANRKFSVPFFHYGLFDSLDRLWVGNSDEGIRVFNEATQSEVTPWDSLTQLALIQQHNLLNQVSLDHKGRPLLAMYDGVFLADETSKKIVALDTLPLLKEIPSATSVMEDKQGNIWATRWGGLSEVSANGKLKIITTTKLGFYDRETKGLAEDINGNVWIGNWEGLYCYETHSNRLLRFTISNGLVSNNTTNCISMSADGKELWVGQQNGFNVVQVEELLKPVKTPVMAISSFKIQDRDEYADPYKPVVLSRDDNSFSVDFITLNYRNEVDNEYAYYLEGLEDTWKFGGSNHNIRYTNLKPGNYTLHIKGGDVINNWFNQQLVVSIEVLPAFYETWWFKMVVLLALVGILYGLYRYRIDHLLRIQRVRNGISADLHDELGSSLSGISIMGTLARKNIPEDHPSTPFIKRIMEETHQISSSLDDIVWSISSNNDTLGSTIARMTRYAAELFEAKQIKYKFTLPENTEGIRLSMEHRRNLYLIFKESTNNLVKYSCCTLASVHIQIVNKNLSFTLTDNGIGFDPTIQNDRNGISNMRDRSARLHGELVVESMPGKGTTIHLTFPMRD